MKHKIGKIYVVLTIITFVVFIVTRFINLEDSVGRFLDIYFVAITVLFNFVIMVLYHNHKQLLTYSVLSTINVLGFYLYMEIFTGENISSILGFLIPLTFFTSVAALLVTFWIALREDYMKFFSRMLMIIAVNNYLFYTIYVTYTERNLIHFFGPFPEAIDFVFDIFYFVKDFNTTFIMILQTIILFYLASGNKFWNYKRTIAKRRPSGEAR